MIKEERKNDNSYTSTDNDVLSEIDKCTEYWQRPKLTSNTVDMKDINFNILDEVEKNRR